MVIITKTQENSVAKDVGKMQPLCTVGRDINWFSHYGKQYAGSSKQLQIELPYEIKPVDPKGNQFWIFLARTDAEAETPTPWCWERSKAGGEGDDRGWDVWMASLTGWVWVWESFRNGWWTGEPGVLQSMWSQRVEHNWVTELNDPAIPLLGLYIQRELNDSLEDIC